VASDHPPGLTKPTRFRPRFHYELLVCGVRGHELLGQDVAQLRAEDAVVVREAEEGLRWHRCLRCDAWLPLPARGRPARDTLPPREDIEVPRRGRALRDLVVLRIIAVDRALHFVVLAAIAVAILLFTSKRADLRGPVFRALADLQGGVGSSGDPGHGIGHELHRLFSVRAGTLTKIGVVVAVYAAVEGAEAVGLWYQKRWAEYLTFLATAALLPLEVYELIHKGSPLKVVTITINLAVVVYLLLAKRLFGLRGGAAAEHAERQADAGWPSLERTAPGALPAPPVTAAG